MADPSAKIQITPKVIDIGDKVIQMAHVTSAGHGTSHPFRVAGVLLLLAAVGLIGFEAMTRGAAAFAFKGGGSLQLWLGFVAAGVSLFLLLYARRQFIIRTADGARTLLATGDDTASAAVLGRIREAMELAGTPALVERADVQPMAFGVPPQAPATLPQEAGLGGRTGGERALPSTAPPAQIASQPAYTQPLGHSRRPQEGQANGHSGPAGYVNGAGRPDPGLIGGAGDLAARRVGTQPATPHRGPQNLGPHDLGHQDFGHQDLSPLQPAAMPQPRAAPAANYAEPMPLPAATPAAAPRDQSGNDLRALMQHVQRADVQHKDALLDLLRVIDEHYRGRASREDAVAHWRSFSDYVMQYLTDVDGMMAHTERFGRHMVSR